MDEYDEVLHDTYRSGLDVSDEICNLISMLRLCVVGACAREWRRYLSAEEIRESDIAIALREYIIPKLEEIKMKAKGLT